ncbi:MAG: hypothetical protein ACJ74H_18420 [Thermoanaerobaculia bacterium]
MSSLVRSGIFLCAFAIQLLHGRCGESVVEVVDRPHSIDADQDDVLRPRLPLLHEAGVDATAGPSVVRLLHVSKTISDHLSAIVDRKKVIEDRIQNDRESHRK